MVPQPDRSDRRPMLYRRLHRRLRDIGRRWFGAAPPEIVTAVTAAALSYAEPIALDDLHRSTTCIAPCAASTPRACRV
jgi:hypothetical protein